MHFAAATLQLYLDGETDQVILIHWIRVGNPVLIDENSDIVAGHGRVSAARQLGISEVPTIRLSNLTPDQVRGYIIADNRLAEKAGWDKSILAIELQHLLSIDSTFDVEVTGCEIPEIDLLLSSPSTDIDQDDIPDKTDDSQPVSKLGDLWHLGRHRLYCGDSLQQASYSTVMGKKRASAVFVDPPYNVPIEGHVCGNGNIHHRQFQMAAGEMDEFQFTSFLRNSLSLLAQYSKDGSIHYVCMDWRHLREMLDASLQAYSSLLNLCVWNKRSGGMGSLYRSKHELVFVFKNGNV